MKMQKFVILVKKNLKIFERPKKLENIAIIQGGIGVLHVAYVI